MLGRLPYPFALAVEPARSPRVALALADVLRPRGAQGNARDDLLWRINRLGEVKLDSPGRLAAFSDVVAAFRPSGFKFRPAYSLCRSTPDNGGVLTLAGELWSGGVKAAEFQRELWVGNRIAYHAYLRTADGFRGTALAPVVLRQSFLYFDRIGIDRALVHAGLETGVYYWARCGFDFVDPTEAQAVHDWFEGCLLALGRNIDISAVRRAYDLALVGKAADENVSFSELANALGRGAPGANIVNHFQERARLNGIAYDEQIELGKAIFITYPDMWWGVLDLDLGGDQRTLFEVYAQSRIRMMVR